MPAGPATAPFRGRYRPSACRPVGVSSQPRGWVGARRSRGAGARVQRLGARTGRHRRRRMRLCDGVRVSENVALWVNLPDVAERLGVPITKVHQLVKEGSLLAVRREGILRVPAELVANDIVLKHVPGDPRTGARRRSGPRGQAAGPGSGVLTHLTYLAVLAGCLVCAVWLEPV